MTEDETPPKRKKATYVGVPQIFILETLCKQINKAFRGQCYLVGSSLERPDWRDVDIRCMLSDKKFEELFPGADLNWEFDDRWLLMTISMSEYMSRVAGVPVDFQFQKQTPTNERHKGVRNAMGLSFYFPEDDDYDKDED